ncbi:heat shock protein HSP90 [Pavlovales sp. CCMP2436]|nr:heat shock protein HSP90 [Pavlovales sp. CCMP2436]
MEKAKRAADAAPEPVDEGPAETVEGAGEKHRFEAETKQLLEIVAKSLYTDKEVFVRELISNASDALEKRRHLALTLGDAASAYAGEGELEIKVSCDSAKRLLVVQDSGLGMKREELVDNLGCIARSGSKAFMEQVKGAGADAGETAAAASNIIGRFGVGFYSVFMVADSVRVFSRHVESTDPEGMGYCWTSTGDGSYELAKANNVKVGTKIEITLKEKESEFSFKYNLERIIRKHSSFVTFPVKLDGERLNTLEPVWMKSKSSVSAEEHEDLYRHIGSAYDTPRYTLQFETDAPIAIKSVFYVPQSHKEKMGMGQQEPCVSLYSRKVLITPKCAEILPGWMRFVVGVVDSEDVPLNISRETMQDSALLRRLNTVLSSRLLKYLAEQGKKEPEGYLSFYKEFGKFLKEGACTDFSHQREILKLLRFESSATKPGEMTSLDEYISRMAPEQKDKLYFLVTSNRKAAESSAYMEVFRAAKTEVLWCYQEIDDFVFQNAGSYEGKQLVPAGAAELKLDGAAREGALTADETEALGKWMAAGPLAESVSDVVASLRLVDSPAVINEAGGQSAAMRRFMMMVDQGAQAATMPKQRLEINPAHPIIVKLAAMRATDEPLASLVAQQLFDNALIGAGMLDDARPMLGRLNDLLERSLAAGAAPAAEPAAATAAATAAEPAAPAKGSE